MIELPTDQATQEETQPPAPEPSSLGPPAGFGKGVNDYLNHFVTVADAKGAALLAVNFVVIQFLLKNHFFGAFCLPLHWGALGMLCLSALTSLLIIFPRLPRGSNGVIFWEDIRENTTPDEYVTKLASIDRTSAESEYAHQNFYVSRVLHRKMYWTQWSVGLFLAGSGFSLVCAIW